jgi:Transposase, Mutator family
MILDLPKILGSLAPFAPLVAAVVGLAVAVLLAARLLPLLRQRAYDSASEREAVRLVVAPPGGLDANPELAVQLIRGLHPRQRRGFDAWRLGWPSYERKDERTTRPQRQSPAAAVHQGGRRRAAHPQASDGLVPADPARAATADRPSALGGRHGGLCPRRQHPQGRRPRGGLGIDAGISKSEVSRICAELDAIVATFRDRSLGHTRFPYVLLDATYVKAHAAPRSCPRRSSSRPG